MPWAVDVIGQRARVRPSCRAKGSTSGAASYPSAAASFDRNKAQGKNGVQMRHKSLMSARLREFVCWFLISVKVGNESGVPARWPRTLHTPSIDPVDVRLLSKRESVVHTKPQRALDGAETSKRTVTVRGLGGDWKPGGKLAGGVVGTLLSEGGGGGDLLEIQGASKRWLLDMDV